jgi:transcriptional regulator with XRE-family HTH domain
MDITVKQGQLVITSNDKVFGNLLKFSRTAMGLSRSDLVFLMKRKVTVTTIANWENEVTLPRPGKLTDLSNILMVDREDMAQAWSISRQKQTETSARQEGV